MKKAAIFNPYLDTLGGGERYALTFAKVLSENGCQVNLEWKDPKIIDSLSKRFDLELTSINVIPDIKKGDGYDICFWVSDGSIPLLRARNNILHFQVPFHGVGGGSLFNKMKLFRINKIVCNSNFTKKVIDKEFGTESVVVYPPVDTKSFKSKRKENIILYVGRFSGMLQNKGQDILVTCFKRFYDSGNKDWKLILAGGVEIGAGNKVKELRKLAEGYPVELYESPDFKILKKLYGEAKIFWSAAGFGQDEAVNPEKMEHFGITVVEAMSAGAVPVIYNAGGYKEIVEDGINGYLWRTEDELLLKTQEAIQNRSDLSKKATAESKIYSYENFGKRIKEILL